MVTISKPWWGKILRMRFCAGQCGDSLGLNVIPVESRVGCFPRESVQTGAFKTLDSYAMELLGSIGKSMKSRMLALLAITLVAAASPAMIALASGVSQAAAHANHSPGTAQCTFTHPTSLPSQASANARDALADRSSHCPPTHTTR